MKLLVALAVFSAVLASVSATPGGHKGGFFRGPIGPRVVVAAPIIHHPLPIVHHVPIIHHAPVFRPIPIVHHGVGFGGPIGFGGGFGGFGGGFKKGRK